MISRRDVLSAALLGWPLTAQMARSAAQTYWAVPTADLRYPLEVRPNKVLGNEPAKQAQMDEARHIWENAPKSDPIQIARYFLDSTKVNPTFIRQWPQASEWNPLIVEFFRSVGYTASSDLIPWCAAFVNWCLVRSGRIGSSSP